MNLRKVLAIGWLLVSFLPIIYFPLSFILMSSGMRGASPDEFNQNFDALFTAHTYVIYFVWILVATYIVYLYKAPYVPRTKRNLWLVVLLCANVFALPFFWFYYVWQPLHHPLPTTTEDEPAQKSKIPILFGLLLVLMMPITFLVMSFQDGKSYDYLTQDFPASDSQKQKIAAGEISISQPKRTHGTIRLEKVLSVSLTESTVAFEPTVLSSALYSAFEVPATAIHSCSRQCGTGRDYILILESAETEIRIEDAPELMDWCWGNQIPMLSSNARREWLYNGTKLPSAEELAESMVTRTAYDAKAKRACQGY